MKKYRVAEKDEHPTKMTFTQFKTITWSFRSGMKESFPRIDVLKEYGEIVNALLNEATIIFSPEEELPF